MSSEACIRFIGDIQESQNEEESSPFNDIWDKYEGIITKSLISAFGLDFIVHDQIGGDVDTIHNVEKIDDPESGLYYKNAENKKDYDERGEYYVKGDPDCMFVKVHKDQKYREVRAKEKEKFNRTGQGIEDAYRSNHKVYIKSRKNHSEDNANLDHVVSAKEIHDSRARVLSGLSTQEVANQDANFAFTSEKWNKTKNQKSNNQFIEEDSKKLNMSSEDIARIKRRDKRARETIRYQENLAYYSSPKFITDTAFASGNVGVRMGLRQAVGLLIWHVYLNVKEQIRHITGEVNFKKIFNAVNQGIKKAFNYIKENFKDFIAEFKNGLISGIISSLTTTLINIFATTAKNIVRLLRQAYAAVVEAFKILFCKPDLLYGDRITAAAKVLAVGASTVLGVAITEALNKTPLGELPVVGDAITTFVGSFASGIVSISFLIFLDRSKLIQKIKEYLNKLDPSYYFIKCEEAINKCLSEINEIDIDRFKKDIESYDSITSNLLKFKDSVSLNKYLINKFKELNTELPWTGDFDTFMSNRNNRLVFK